MPKGDNDRALLAAMLAATFDCIVTVDERGSVLEFNHGAERTFGYRREEAVGRSIAELIVPPHLRERHRCGMARYLATGERHVLGRRVEIEGMRADGSLFPVELAIAEVKLGERRLFTAYLRDITERRQAEEQLRQSEQRFRAIVEDQTELILRFGADRRVTFVNRALAGQLGQPPATLIGTSVLDHVDERNRGWFSAQLDALTPAAPTVSYETENVLPGGGRAWEHWTDRALFDEAGQLVGYQSVGRDVTAAKRAENELRESEERYRTVVEDLTEVVGRYDANFRLVFANAAIVAALGQPPDELLGSDFFAYVPARLRQGLRRRLLALTPERPTYVAENEKILPDGTERWFHWTNRALFDASGKLTGYQAVGRDITELKQAQEALREREALLSAIIATQTEWVTRRDLANRYTFVNAAYCRYMGLSAERLCSDSYDADASIEPEDRARFIALRERTTPQEPTFTAERRVRRPDGSHRIEEWTETAIFDGEGRRVGFQAVGRDITGQWEAEEKIRRQREQLLQQEKLTALGSLLAGVAHELNNPLSVVVGFAALLHEDVRDKAIRDSAKQIHVAAQRCARIVNTFLAMARQKPPAFGPVKLATSVAEALEIVGYPLRSTGITVVRRIPADLPPVHADPDQLHQVITNLVINAQQALADCPEPRSIEVAASSAEDMVEFVIADNGPGIPPELRRRAFEPFFTTKPQGVGTGLGLAVCHGIVTSHHGTIDIEPREAGGTVVRVRLPAAQRTRRRKSGDSSTKVLGSILVVDDEPGIVSSIRELLRREGHKVEVATDGRAALGLLEGVDLVITDLRMPGMDGMALIARLRSVAPRLAENALIMTGDILRATVDPALAPLRDRMIEKPVDLGLLRRRVRRALHYRRPL